MAQEPLPINVPPGFIKVDSPLAEAGRYTDGFGVRFFRGKAEKVGGFVSLLTANMLGIVRGLLAWNDLTSARLIAAGTTLKLYTISDRTFTPIDITPFIATETIAGPLTTNNASSIVQVHFPSHGAIVGQYLYITGSTAVGGLTINGEFAVTGIVDLDNVLIDVVTHATSNATGGGTPTISLELPPGQVNPTNGVGFGAGGWGTGAWGGPRGSSTIKLDPRSWSLGNFGKILLASPSGGKLYQWDPSNPLTTRASLVTQAPESMAGFFITAERFVTAFGVNNDPLAFQWCGQGDFTDWNNSELTGALGSPSRSRRLQDGRKIMAGADLGGFVSLIWTDSTVHSHQYTGSTYIFNTQLLGSDCGLIGPEAYVVVQSTAYWLSSNGFFMSVNGGPVERIPKSDDISEWFFNNLRPNYGVKSFAWYVPRFDEIRFAFCGGLSSDPSLVLVYNTKDQFWFTDVLTRTAATSFDGSDARPILAGTDGMLYQHEQGVDANGSPLPWMLQTALLEIENGATSFEVESYYPDMDRQVGNINLTLLAYDRTPKASIETATGTFSPTDDAVDFRIAGREMSMKMEGGTGTGDDFRIGSPKVSLVRTGRRQ